MCTSNMGYITGRGKKRMGRLGNGELDKLEYVNVNDALKLPMFDITEFILQEIKIRIEKGNEIKSNPVFWRYRKHQRLITEIKILD